MRRGLAVVSTFLAIAFVGSATVACATASVSALSPAVAGIHLERTTIPDLQQAMNRGQLSSVQLTSFYLQRIEALNPNLHAVITTNPDALQLAAESDARRRERHTRGAMDGIPVLVKDNIDTADKQATTAGSFALAHNRPARDAGVVTRLRDAGAVILGKANMSRMVGLSVGQRFEWVDVDRWADQQPVRLGPQPLRLVERFGRRGVCSPGHRRCRHGDRRFHRVSVRAERDRRREAESGAGQPERRRTDQRPSRTLPGRWPAMSSMRPSCSRRWTAPTRVTRPPWRQPITSWTTIRRSWNPSRCRASGSACGATRTA